MNFKPLSLVGRRCSTNHWCVGLVLMLACAAPSFAKTLNVTNTDDSGPGSLRDAIATAHSGDRIEFGVTGTISLTGGSLMLDKSLTIAGPGATHLAVSGDDESPVWIIGSQNRSITAAISGLTIQHGGADIPPLIGAGILNHGILKLVESTVSDNENLAGAGGGIFNDGTLTLVKCTVSRNDSNGGGGGISNNGPLTLMNSTVSDNSVSNGNGGGIVNGSTLTLINSAVSDNTAEEGSGIFNNGGTLNLTDSTVSGNSTVFGGPGGGVYIVSGAVTMINSTLTNNSTGNGGGGGVYNQGGTLTVTNTTIAGNSTAHEGAGVYNAGVLTVKSILFANNVTLAQGIPGSCFIDDPDGGTATSLGYNVTDDGSCASFMTAAGDENNVTPGAGLDPNGLHNNGGPTQTIALLSGTPAVDHIPLADCTDANGNSVKADQRGIKRPQGLACDTGAFELVQTVPFSNFKALLAIETGQHSGFGLASSFTLGKASNGIDPLTEPVTLQIANYSVNIPVGSFHRLWSAPSAPYEYDGTINGTKLVVGFIPLGGQNYQFNAVGSTIAWNSVANPVTVSLTVGNASGKTAANAAINPH